MTQLGEVVLLLVGGVLLVCEAAQDPVTGVGPGLASLDTAARSS